MRFTTVDPIRDGSNWFVYVNNDPVNYIDLWGLLASEPKKSVIDTFKTWWDKADGSPLTEEEAELQRNIGIVEMVVGPVGGTALSAIDPAGFLAGMYVMADGAMVVADAQNKIKKTPLASIPNTFLMPYVESDGIILPAGGTFIW